MKNNTEKYQIFCDLDGVLVDLMGGINDAIYNQAPENSSKGYISDQMEARQSLDGKKLQERDANKNSKHFKKAVRKFMYRVMSDDRHFWINLKWQPGGKNLWSYIQKFNPKILSRPTDLQSVIGKKKWVKDNLKLSGSDVQIKYDKNKFATVDGKIGILIDDFQTNTIPFEQHGGKSILYKNPDQAIEELKAIGF